MGVASAEQAVQWLSEQAAEANPEPGECPVFARSFGPGSACVETTRAGGCHAHQTNRRCRPRAFAGSAARRKFYAQWWRPALFAATVQFAQQPRAKPPVVQGAFENRTQGYGRSSCFCTVGYAANTMGKQATPFRTWLSRTVVKRKTGQACSGTRSCRGTPHCCARDCGWLACGVRLACDAARLRAARGFLRGGEARFQGSLRVCVRLQLVFAHVRRVRGSVRGRTLQ